MGQEDPCRRKWQPTPVSLPGKFHGQRSLEHNSPWGCKESNTTEQQQRAHTHTHTHTKRHNQRCKITPMGQEKIFTFHIFIYIIYGFNAETT